MSTEQLKDFILKQWHEDCIPELMEYIKIPNMSPFFDDEALTNGLIDEAMELVRKWIVKQEVEGLIVDVFKEPGRTPIMILELPPTDPEKLADKGTVLFYGHVDKQPPVDGWDEGLGPYKPVIRDGKLYGRGSADDGYAAFCIVLALKALKKYKIPHSRVIAIIEAGEESGSPDLPFYLEKFADKIGSPNLVFCVDSGCGNYEQLWITASLRGVIGGNLKVKITNEGLHSGDSSGVVPGTFRIARSILSRLEDEKTGEVLIPELQTKLSPSVMEKVRLCTEVMGHEGMAAHFKLVPGARYTSEDIFELALRRWWKPQLVITGADGLPTCKLAGSVLRPETKLALSMRLPPTVDADFAQEAMTKVILADPPYGAEITFDAEKSANGWALPEVSPWLETAIESSSQAMFAKPAMYFSEGGSIPLMYMLGKRFPKAQFCVIGLLGPGSNPHGPNECLHIDFAGRLSGCIALILQQHCEANAEKNC